MEMAISTLVKFDRDQMDQFCGGIFGRREKWKTWEKERRTQREKNKITKNKREMLRQGSHEKREGQAGSRGETWAMGAMLSGRQQVLRGQS